MIWLELRKNGTQYHDGWNFSQSVWAPTRKRDGSLWPFWYLIKDIQKDDIIVHLKYIDGIGKFVDYSYAATGAYITNEYPIDDKHEWDFSRSFYKVDLWDYQPFEPDIPISDFFKQFDDKLRTYFEFNKARKDKKKLFYVVQGGRLQCLNGAYFSEFDEQLIDLLFEPRKVGDGSKAPGQNVDTDERLTKLKARIGHRQFAENVKRNYNYKCCFPGCNITGRGFLISSHIARWKDNATLRGDTENGLCLCLTHDKAFEMGYFTLDSALKIRVIEKNLLRDNLWIRQYLYKGDGAVIKRRDKDPSPEILQEHWLRIGYNH